MTIRALFAHIIGFFAIATLTGCQQYLTSSYGTFFSPNYPNNYPNNLKYTWTIQPGGFQPETNTIILTFSSFILESCCDFVRIFSYENATVPLSAKQTGDLSNLTLSFHIKSPFTVVMTTDGSVTYSGFFASYRIVLLEACQRYITSSNGTLVSPNYPNAYPNNLNCKWTIDPVGLQLGTNYIKLTFTTLDIEDAPGCGSDYVQVFKDEYMTAPVSDKICGDRKNLSYYIQSTPMAVVMRSNDSVVRGGFIATFQIVAPVFLQQLTTASGSFYSPNFPYTYLDYLNYKWTIQPDGFQSGVNSILLTFGTLSLERCCDFVQIFAYSNATVPLSAKQTGDQSNLIYYIHSSPFTVVMTSDGSVVMTGFNASYQIVPLQDCQQYISSAAGTFASPGYPNSYPNIASCKWTIQPTGLQPGTNIVQLIIRVLDIEDTPTCSYNYLQVYYDEYVTVPLSDRLCGNNADLVYYIQSSPFSVVMISNGSLVRKRFTASYQIRPIIIAGPPVTLISNLSTAVPLTVPEGSNASFSCQVSAAIPVAAVYWTVGNVQVSKSSNRLSSGSLDHGNAITSFYTYRGNRNDQGKNITCTATWRSLTYLSAYTVINVTYPPMLTIQAVSTSLPSSTPLLVSEHSNLTLLCVASGGNPAIVTGYQWQFSGQFPEHPVLNVSSSNVSLNDLRYYDTGTYSCIVTHLTGASIVRRNISIKYAPMDLTAHNITYTNINDAVFLTVTFRSYNENINVRWIYGNTSEKTGYISTDQQDVFNSTLNLTSVDESDLGVYTVNVSNSQGSVLIHGQLEIYQIQLTSQSAVGSVGAIGGGVAGGVVLLIVAVIVVVVIIRHRQDSSLFLHCYKKNTQSYPSVIEDIPQQSASEPIYENVIKNTRIDQPVSENVYQLDSNEYASYNAGQPTYDNHMDFGRSCGDNTYENVTLEPLQVEPLQDHTYETLKK